MADTVNNTMATDLALIDTQLLLLGGGEGRTLMSFDLPPELDQSTIETAEFSVSIADGTQASGPIGDLHQVSSFSMTSLESAAPELLALLDVSEEVGQQGKAYPRPIDAMVISDGLEQGHVYLGLVGTTSDVTIFHGSGSELELQPTLTIFHK